MSVQTCCPVVELRQYTLKPRQRDVLIELFEREFIESQEATGMRIIGTFRDLDNPDHFLWLRGFSDMPARAQALEEFYGGPVRKKNREAANATMIDSDNVLLLRPARSGSRFSLANAKRPSLGSTETAKGVLVAFTDGATALIPRARAWGWVWLNPSGFDERDYDGGWPERDPCLHESATVGG
jgi:hypothetical protein